MVGLEGVEELFEDFILSLLTGSHVWVVSRVVELANVSYIQLPTLVGIELVKGTLDQVLSELVHLTDNCA